MEMNIFFFFNLTKTFWLKTPVIQFFWTFFKTIMIISVHVKELFPNDTLTQ